MKEAIYHQEWKKEFEFDFFFPAALCVSLYVIFDWKII